MKTSKVTMGPALFLLLTLPACAQQDEKTRRWASDIDFIADRITSLHPDPWHRVTQESFVNEVARLKTDLPGLSEEEIIVRAMQLVASIQDGHTALTPYNHPLIPVWFPIRMDEFADGIFITGITERHADLVGAKVVRIGKCVAEECFRLIGLVTSVDSPVGSRRTVPTYLPNATILKGLGIIPTTRSLPLEVVSSTGEARSVVVASVGWPFDGGWARDRNTVPGYGRCVTVFSDKMDTLPSHLWRALSGKEKYWFELLPESRALYFQFNSVSNDKELFAEFVARLWEAYDKSANGIEKFIVDIRYNDGGDGTLLQPLVHGFIKHEGVNRRGRLFIIIGGGTFSAASNFLGQMIEHTNAITVGETASGPLNWFSDIERLSVPSGRLGLDVSTMYWQGGHPLDARGCCPPEYPVPVTAEDYFSGKDRTLEAILHNEVVTLRDVLHSKGADVFLEEYEKWSRRFASNDPWFPYTVFDLRNMGVELFSQGRRADAVALFGFTARLHPDVYWVWEILGNIHVDAGDRDEGIKCLRQALKLNPHDSYVKRSLSRLTSREE